MNKNEFVVALARRISTHRQLCGFTQKHFAQKVGISVSYLSKLESGRCVDGMSMQVLMNIAESLDMSVYELVHLHRIDCQRARIFLEKRKSYL